MYDVKADSETITITQKEAGQLKAAPELTAGDMSQVLVTTGEVTTAYAAAVPAVAGVFDYTMKGGFTLAEGASLTIGDVSITNTGSDISTASDLAKLIADDVNFASAAESTNGVITVTQATGKEAASEAVNTAAPTMSGLTLETAKVAVTADKGVITVTLKGAVDIAQDDAICTVTTTTAADPSNPDAAPTTTETTITASTAITSVADLVEELRAATGIKDVYTVAELDEDAGAVGFTLAPVTAADLDSDNIPIAFDSGIMANSTADGVVKIQGVEHADAVPAVITYTVDGDIHLTSGDKVSFGTTEVTLSTDVEDVAGLVAALNGDATLKTSYTFEEGSKANTFTATQVAAAELSKAPEITVDGASDAVLEVTAGDVVVVEDATDPSLTAMTLLASFATSYTNNTDADTNDLSDDTIDTTGYDTTTINVDDIVS